MVERSMGLERLVGEEKLSIAKQSVPLVLGLQPAALVDHVARVDWSLLDQISGDRGGSVPVAREELDYILREVNTHTVALPGDSCSVKALAGGSVANTIRGLSAGFGVSTGIIGAYGDDDEGKFFTSNMQFNGVNLSRLRPKKGSTGQCVCLVDEFGNRTMRPCLSSAVKIQESILMYKCSSSYNSYLIPQPDEIANVDFTGAKWLVMRYAPLNSDVIEEAIRLAKEEGLSISMDLASFEMVRTFRKPLMQILESGNIDLCLANEDEAAELLMGDTEAALNFLSKHCEYAVVTLGANGCIAKHREEIVRVPAIGESKAVDTTGAGDLFACGFVYGRLNGLSLKECCEVGACCGGTVIRSLGAEVSSENWQWAYKHMLAKDLPLPHIRN